VIPVIILSELQEAFPDQIVGVSGSANYNDEYDRAHPKTNCILNH